jgi:beta-phosphoglucomutase-like phosphatase (HAD superfamily)
METRTGTAAAQLQRGLLIEADLAVLPGTDLMMAACKAPLSHAGVKLDRDLFVRCIFGRPLTKGVEALLDRQGKSTSSAGEVAGEIAAKYAEALQGAAGKARDAILAMSKNVAGRGVKVGLITQLPEEAARECFADGIAEGVHILPDTAAIACVHGWESWRRASHKLQIRERLCVAIAVPGSVRGALAASMRVVAIADPAQEHADCGGADLLTETFDAAARATTLALLRMD